MNAPAILPSYVSLLRNGPRATPAFRTGAVRTETAVRRTVRTWALVRISAAASKVATLIAAVAVLALLVAAVSASSPLGEIHLTKTCASTFPSPPICTVITSSAGPIPVGTVAHYSLTVFDAQRLSAGVVLVTPDGSTATGGCTLSFMTGLGTCSFVNGAGSLAGFHADIDVTFHFDTGVTNWDGSYFLAP